MSALSFKLETRALTSSERWSSWLQFCENTLDCPEFYCAREPLRNAVRRAYESEDYPKVFDLVSEFRAANDVFHQQVSRELFNNKDVMGNLVGGSVVYLCAGVEFSAEFGSLVGSQGRLFLVDYAEATAARLRREMAKHVHTSPNVHVINSPVQQIGDPNLHEYLLPGTISMIVAIRGLHRVETSERIQTINACKTLLKPGGVFCLIELFEDNRPASRKPTPGTWYWTISQYKKALSPLQLVHDSGAVLDNQNDKNRLLVFR